MKNSICTIILSIIEVGEQRFIESKLRTLETQLNLNEVEKRIIEDIRNQFHLGNKVTISYIRDKYSYYTDNDTNTLAGIFLSKDSIDSAITDMRMSQLKQSLSKELLDFGSKIDELNPTDIKERLAKLSSNLLIENKFVVPTNGVQLKENAYEDLQISKDGMSLVLPRIEEHAGRAAKGTMVTIAAFTGSFKSTFALNIAYENCLAGYNILYLALEDTEDKIFSRLVLKHLACTAKSRKDLIDARLIRDGKLNKEQQKIYNNTHNDLVKKLNNHLILWDSTKIMYDTFLDMTNTLRLADKKFMQDTGKGLDAVIIDQISLLKYKSGSGRKASYDGQIINDWVSYFREQMLNFLGEDRQITVFNVTQTSRDAFAEASKPKKKGRYDSSCSSDSHEIERSSSTMITLYKDLETKNTLLINIPKTREGFPPDNPIQTEVYGEYFHIGPLNNFTNEHITAEEFENTEVNLEDLINIS